MPRTALIALLIITIVVPTQAAGLRFHCLKTGARDLVSCCCTGSMLEACGETPVQVKPGGCGS